MMIKDRETYIREWRRKTLKNFANQGLLPLCLFLISYYDDQLTPEQIADLLNVNETIVKEQLKEIDRDCEQIISIFADVNPFLDEDLEEEKEL